MTESELMAEYRYIMAERAGMLMDSGCHITRADQLAKIKADEWLRDQRAKLKNTNEAIDELDNWLNK